MSEPGRDFGATLSRRAKLVTWGVGFGVGLGVPIILSVAFGIAFGTPYPLILPLITGVLLLLAWRYRIVGYRLDTDAIRVLRPAGSAAIVLSDVAEIRFPASRPPGAVIGLWRVEGLFGTQGTYWNRSWGRFRLYVTDDKNTVEILLRDGRRVLLSPDDPALFVAQLQDRLPRR